MAGIRPQAACHPDSLHYARGMCARCYDRWLDKQHAKPPSHKRKGRLTGRYFIADALRDFVPDSNKHWSEYPCILWNRSTNLDGYGRIYREDGTTVGVHRFAYELVFGPIPDGMEPDHLCRNRTCFCPAHMEPVTHKENMRRSPVMADPAIAQRKREATHCPNGHKYTPETTGFEQRANRRVRYCRLCKRNGLRKHYWANRDSINAARRTGKPIGRPKRNAN